MTRVSAANDIWVLRPTIDDLRTAARYASLTLPWTFNRMMMNTSSKGQQSRALNIAKGILGQEMLKRALPAHRISAEVQKKSYRDDDLFDFRVVRGDNEITMDIKTMNYFTNYAGTGRSPFSADLILTNRSYPGPDWRRFFPMLVPHTQIGQGKESYCFAIATSIDFRADNDTDRMEYALTAFPYGQLLPFFSNRALCSAREGQSQGVHLDVDYVSGGLLGAPVDLTVLGEWDGDTKLVRTRLQPDSDRPVKLGPFSCITSFQISREDYQKLAGSFRIRVCRNDLASPVRNSQGKNVNVIPDDELIIAKSDFCNLILPTGYSLYVLGWITRDEFLQSCIKYPAWVWPNDAADKYSNTPWSQITERDHRMLARIGLDDRIETKPSRLRAGLLKTHGSGGGACCYVYPNIGRYGGVRETNLYVLPDDLYPMKKLGQDS